VCPQGVRGYPLRRTRFPGGRRQSRRRERRDAGVIRMKPLVMALSGRIGSGKTTVSTEVARRLGWVRTSFGDYVRSLARSRGLDDSRETLQPLGASVLNEGVEPFCRAVLAQAGWTSGTPVVI